MRLHSGVFLVALIALPLHAQQQPQPFTGKIDVTLVNVDVTVTSHGEPVRGLTRDDFEVFEDGRRQEITSFDAVEQASPVAGAAAPDAAQPADPRFRRRVLVIVDNRNTSVFRRNLALTRLESFIDDHFSGGEYDWSIALIDRRVRLFLPSTSDKTSIHAALDTIRAARGHPRESMVADEATRGSAAPRFVPTPPDEPMTLRSEQRAEERGAFLERFNVAGELTIAADTNSAIVEALRAFATTTGKKIVLLLTTDLGTNDFSSTPSSWRFAETPLAAARIRNILRDCLIREANASNVNLYIINTEGLAPGDMQGAAMTDNATLYWVARETGGRLMPGNDLADSMRTFDTVSSNFYSLAYKPAHGDDMKYHRIAVRLKRPGRYLLQYRDGYSSIPVNVQIERALGTTLSALVQSPSLSVSATSRAVRTAGGGVVVPIDVRIPLKDLQFTPEAEVWRAHVDLYVSIFDSEGKNLALRRFTTTATSPSAAAVEGDLIHNATVTLMSGKPHTIVLAVHDRTTDAVGIARQVVR